MAHPSDENYLAEEVAVVEVVEEAAGVRGDLEQENGCTIIIAVVFVYSTL